MRVVSCLSHLLPFAFFYSSFYIARIKAVGLNQNIVSINLLFYLVRLCIEAECNFEFVKNVVYWSS